MNADIRRQINLIVDNIFNYNIKEAMNLLEVLFKSIDIYIQNNEFTNISSLNEILILMEKAICSKDYLLLSDILKFELYEISSNKYLN